MELSPETRQAIERLVMEQFVTMTHIVTTALIDAAAQACSRKEGRGMSRDEEDRAIAMLQEIIDAMQKRRDETDRRITSLENALNQSGPSSHA